jgi:hypothetical protein
MKIDRSQKPNMFSGVMLRDSIINSGEKVFKRFKSFQKYEKGSSFVEFLGFLVNYSTFYPFQFERETLMSI